jgi:hypothetical protein
MKWSHVPLTFDTRDVDLHSAPHMDAMVINCSVTGWDLHKVLVDNGSQADIIFLHAFDRMGISHSLLKPSDNPLYGFGGKGTFPVGKIELPLSFGVAPNARSEQVTFDIVDMVYPYNAIMGWGSINKFEAAIHGLYLCMKIPGPQGVITVYGNQQTARNIERDFIPGQRNMHCLTTQREVPNAPPHLHSPQSARTTIIAYQSRPREDDLSPPRHDNAYHFATIHSLSASPPPFAAYTQYSRPGVPRNPPRAAKAPLQPHPTPQNNPSPHLKTPPSTQSNSQNHQTQNT